MGFSPSITCGVWVGFDEKKTLGNKETGSLAALPIWIDFMRVAIAGHEQEQFAEPLPPRPRARLAKHRPAPSWHRPGDLGFFDVRFARSRARGAVETRA